MTLVRLALGLLLLAPAAPAAEKLDRAALKKIEELALRWWKARPKTKYDAWEADTRQQLLAEAARFGEIPEGSWEAVRDALWKPLKKHGPRARRGGKATIETPYGEMWAYVKGTGRNKGLVVGLHGGGKGAGSADGPAGTWMMKGCMGMYPQGLVLTGDNWNTVHGEKHILTLMEIAKAQYNIDPDRVYVTGFSMGGTGSWHMAGRFPDLFAGAAPCAGVVMASPKSQVGTKEEVASIQYGIVPNVRNLAMYYFIGLKDVNCMPGTYLFVADFLDELRQEDPEGYGLVRFKTYPNLAHAFPPGEPGNCIRWLSDQRRDTFPKKLVWEYATRPFPLPESHDKTSRYQRTRFYWLRHDAPQDRMEITARREGNRFDIRTSAERRGFYLLLNPEMIDVNEEVVVFVDDEEAYRGRPRPDLETLLETLDAHLDRRMCFDRKIQLWKE